MGKVLQAIAKAERLGLDNFHPDESEYTNRAELIDKLDTLIYVCTQMIEDLSKM